jgi:hypothetical protein
MTATWHVAVARVSCVGKQSTTAMWPDSRAAKIQYVIRVLGPAVGGARGAIPGPHPGPVARAVRRPRTNPNQIRMTQTQARVLRIRGRTKVFPPHSNSPLTRAFSTESHYSVGRDGRLLLDKYLRALRRPPWERIGPRRGQHYSNTLRGPSFVHEGVEVEQGDKSTTE